MLAGEVATRMVGLIGGSRWPLPQPGVWACSRAGSPCCSARAVLRRRAGHPL